MVYKPVPVPEQKITSVDVTNFGGGLFLHGDQNGPANCFVSSKDSELDVNGFLIPRRRLVPFLPDTIEVTYQKFPVLWNNQIYYFTLDDGKARFCLEGATGWTECSGTSNSFVTLNGGFPKFIRVLDAVLILNGKNGDKLAYIDLKTAGFPIVKYTLVTNPAAAMTGILTNLAAGAFKVYYSFTWSGAVGETELAPILSVSINRVRDQWQTSTPGSIKLARPAGAAPTGARYWNLYIAIAATAGTIQPSDMLQLAVKLDLTTTEFVDDGSLAINLGSVPPSANSTDGPKVLHGIVEDGNPILFGDEDNPYNIWIGGGGPNALDFSVSNGGYRAEPEKGTNFYPTTIIGFRTGNGSPALTILYSNTEGLSKQSTLVQQTVSYGDQSFTVWGVTEQHYGAAGVAAPNSAINYNGKLLFLSTDGFLSAQTQPSVQNVMSILPISSPIDPYVRAIKNAAMDTVVGTGWNNKYMWLVPNAGFDTPQQILILDTNSQGLDGNGAWYALDIPANWIGVISPRNDAAFVYISQGNKTYKLLASDSTYDTKDGVRVPFSTGATGPLLGMGGKANNTWQADVQTMFYIMGLVGSITLGVRYRNQNNKLKVKTRIYNGPTFVPSASGGYGDPAWSYSNLPSYADTPVIDNSGELSSPVDVRVPVQVDDIMSEGQWFYSTPIGYNKYRIKAISFEGISLGVRPDLR
ncbi:MAG: hypothetical protein ACR2FM_04930 [Candidatus Saccharimonadales bacterium]